MFHGTRIKILSERWFVCRKKVHCYKDRVVHCIPCQKEGMEAVWDSLGVKMNLGCMPPLESQWCGCENINMGSFTFYKCNCC